MIIGNGLIAEKFRNELYDKYVVFASGVSDSSNTNIDKFEREKSLLVKTISTITNPIIYFSTISSLNTNSPYFDHKRNMESLILESGIDYYIFRLPQVLGNGGNPNNLINYFKSKIISGVHFDIMADSYRSIIDVDDVLLISTHIVNNFNKNKIYNIAGIEFKKVSEIVIYLEEILLKKSNTSIIDKVSDIIKENSNEVEESINALSINRKDYIKNILQKYVTDIRRDK